MALFYWRVYHKLSDHGDGISGIDGKRVVLRGMNTYPSKVVSSHSMEAVLRQGDIEWDVECYISNKETLDCLCRYPIDIQALLHKHKHIF